MLCHSLLFDRKGRKKKIVDDLGGRYEYLYGVSWSFQHARLSADQQFCLAICGSQVSKENLVPAYIAIVFAFVFVAFFPMGFLGVNFLYSQEVITTRYRAPASGISTATHWLSVFVIVLTTPIGFTSLGWKFYLVWAVVAGSIVPAVYFFYPETTGLSVEEIDQVFIDAPGVFSIVALAESRRRERKSNEVEHIEHFDNEKRKEEYLEQAVVDSRGPQVHHT